MGTAFGIDRDNDYILPDPGADRIVFWDESANAPAYLAVGAGLVIDGTTLRIDLSSTLTLAALTVTGSTALQGAVTMSAGATVLGGFGITTGDLTVSVGNVIVSAGNVILSAVPNIAFDIISTGASVLCRSIGSSGDQWQYGCGILSAGDWGVTNVTRLVNALVIQGGTATPNITVINSLQTGAPSGGTAAAWKFGVAAVVSPTAPNRTVELDVGGTIYYLHAKTTNN